MPQYEAGKPKHTTKIRKNFQACLTSLTESTADDTINLYPHLRIRSNSKEVKKVGALVM